MSNDIQDVIKLEKKLLNLYMQGMFKRLKEQGCTDVGAFITAYGIKDIDGEDSEICSFTYASSPLKLLSLIMVNAINKDPKLKEFFDGLFTDMMMEELS